MDSAKVKASVLSTATAPDPAPAVSPASSATSTPADVAGLLEDPIMDFSKFTTSNETRLGDEALTGETIAALKKILGAKPTVSQAVEVDHILLLIISKMRTLGSFVDNATIYKDTWVDEIMELAGSDDGLRMLTGMKVATMIKNAPWGLEPQEDDSSLEFVRSINAIGAGVERFTRILGNELKKAKKDGVTLTEYYVPEFRPDLVSEGEEMREEVEEKSEGHAAPPRKGNAKVKKPAALRKNDKGRAPVSTTSGTVGTGGHGNHKHGSTVPWTNAEHIGLLEAYEANPNRKLVSHAAMADMHNTRFWNGLEVRTPPSVAQQFLKMTGRDYGRITGKIAQMRADIAAGNP